MSFLDDIWSFLNDIGKKLVDGIVFVLGWLKDRLAELRGTVTDLLVQAMSNPWGALATLVGVTLVTVAVQSVYDTLKKTAAFIAVENFFLNIVKTVDSVTKALHLDALLILTSLSDAFIADFHNALIPIYKAFSDLTTELEKDTSFINVFAESNRAILRASYSFVPNGALQAEVAYAEGMSDFLSGLKAKLGKYTANPELIFTDMASMITASRAKESDSNVAKLWAGIDFSARWIVERGNNLITLVSALDTAMRGFPDEVQTAIKVWYDPLKKDFDDFVSKKWNVFTSQYQDFASRINDAFSQIGIDIAYLEARIDSPVTLLRMILMQPEPKKQSALADLADLNKTAEAGDLEALAESLDPIVVPLNNPPDFTILLPEPPPATAVADLPDAVTPTEEIAVHTSPFELAITGDHRAPGLNASWYIAEAS